MAQTSGITSSCERRELRAIAAALAQAREAPEGKDVRLGGGVNVIQKYLRQRLIDEMHIPIAPVVCPSNLAILARSRLDANRNVTGCTNFNRQNKDAHLRDAN